MNLPRKLLNGITKLIPKASVTEKSICVKLVKMIFVKIVRICSTIFTFVRKQAIFMHLAKILLKMAIFKLNRNERMVAKVTGVGVLKLQRAK